MASRDADWEHGPRDDARGNGRSPSPRRERSRSPPRRDDRGRAGGEGSNNPGNNLHVSGLDRNATDEELESLFSKYGAISKAQVMRDPQTREVRGFGFVTFQNPEDAEAAMDGLNATDFLGRTITVTKARRGRARTPTPGQYQGPPKDRGMPRGGGYDDRRGYGGGGGGRYDDRDYRRDDRYSSSRHDSYGSRGGGGGGGRYDDRRDDHYDRRGSGRDGYDDRRRY